MKMSQNINKEQKEETKRRTQEEDIITIFRWFRKGNPIPSGYKAVRLKYFEEIAGSTLKRDLRELVENNYLESKIGSRNAKSYFLTFKGFLAGLKTDAFSPEEMRQVRLANNIKFPLITRQIPIQSDTDKIIKIAKIMEEYDPRLFYNLIYKFDLAAFPEDALGIIWITAGIGTTIIDYTLNPEEFIKRIKGAKMVKGFKEGKIPYTFAVILSICLPALPEEIQTELTEKLKEMGVTLPNLSLEKLFKN